MRTRSGGSRLLIAHAQLLHKAPPASVFTVPILKGTGAKHVAIDLAGPGTSSMFEEKQISQ